MTEQSCEHGQLYAHMRVAVTVPIEHNSALEISRARDKVVKTLWDNGFNTFKIIGPIEVDESNEGYES